MLKYIKSFNCLVIAALLTGVHGVSAEISTAKNTWGDEIIVFRGQIQKGDFEKLKAVVLKVLNNSAEYSSPLHMHLDTEGGDVIEAIKIGRFARDLLLSVDSYGKIIVDPRSSEGKGIYERSKNDPDYVFLESEKNLEAEHIVRNYSAGLLIFYGAVERSHRDNSDQRMGFYKAISIPVMGLHRPYFDKEYFSALSPSQAASEYEKMEKSVRDYLTEMGAPQLVLDDMFRYPSNQIHLVKAEEFRKLYKSQESFLDEWLISRCGAAGDYKDVLSKSELEDWPQIEREQIAKRLADKDAKIGSMKIYDSDRFEMSYISGIYEKIRRHNRGVGLSRKKTIMKHQISWMKSQNP